MIGEITSWAVTILTVMLLGGGIWYIFGLLKLPLAERPKTPTYDRFGELLGMEENPEYHVHTGSPSSNQQKQN